MDKVRIGIIGFGKMGSQHSKAFKDGKVPNAVLTCVADIDPKRIDAAKALLGDGVSYFDNAESLIASGKCDAVIPTVPHYYHPVYAIEAFNHGLNYLCEKPAGVYTNQVKRMNEAAAASGKVFGIMYNQKTNPVYQKARDLVRSGEIGELQRTNWIITNWFRSQSYYDQSSWRATWKGEGGGVLLNQNPHNLDLFQWICGMPSRVKAEMYYGKYRHLEVEEEVYALVEYPNGATGCYITTIADSPGTNRFEITGTKGKLVIENDKIEFFRLRKDTVSFNEEYKGGIGQPECWRCEIPVKGTYTSHPGLIKNFCDAILTGSPLLAPGEEGILGLSISNAMHLSSWLGSKWIDLPIDGDLYEAELKKKCGGELPA